MADVLGPAAAFPFPVAFPLAAAALGVFFLVSAAAAMASSSEVFMARSDRIETVARVRGSGAKLESAISQKSEPNVGPFGTLGGLSYQMYRNGP